MPRFFVPDLSGETVTIAGEDGRHIAKSLRCHLAVPTAGHDRAQASTLDLVEAVAVIHRHKGRER